MRTYRKGHTLDKLLQSGELGDGGGASNREAIDQTGCKSRLGSVAGTHQLVLRIASHSPIETFCHWALSNKIGGLSLACRHLLGPDPPIGIQDLAGTKTAKSL